MPKYIFLQEVESTNTFLKRTANQLPSGTVIYTHTQTAGRGQKGNSWESFPGKNITFSQLLKNPRIAVKEQFFLSEAVSLAIVDALELYATGFKIKWPNDIYYGDHKICGILIEQSLDNGSIAYSVVGVGVNINQTMFVSNAPNPVSLSNITGLTYDTEEIMHRICENIEQYCDFDGNRAQLEALHKRYLEKLYRYDGQPHAFTTPANDTFDAIIEAVHPDGTLILRHISNNTCHEYKFKEVGFVINKVRFL